MLGLLLFGLKRRMPNGTYGVVRGRTCSALLDFWFPKTWTGPGRSLFMYVRFSGTRGGCGRRIRSLSHLPPAVGSGPRGHCRVQVPSLACAAHDWAALPAQATCQHLGCPLRVSVHGGICDDRFTYSVSHRKAFVICGSN